MAKARAIGTSGSGKDEGKAISSKSSGSKEAVYESGAGPKDSSGASNKFEALDRILLEQTIGSFWTSGLDAERLSALRSATYYGLRVLAPSDPMEAMIASQLLATHNAAMECYRRAMIDGQFPANRTENLNQAVKLSRTHAALLDALNKHRGKGHQKVTVEHVHVNSGGHAIVGRVDTAGGARK
jgi:hypothetical protein